jgi:hypothetical protein
MNQTYARKHDKIPILVLRKPGNKTRLAVVDMDHLVSILKGKGLIEVDVDLMQIRGR